MNPKESAVKQNRMRSAVDLTTMPERLPLPAGPQNEPIVYQAPCVNAAVFECKNEKANRTMGSAAHTRGVDR